MGATRRTYIWSGIAIATLLTVALCLASGLWLTSESMVWLFAMAIASVICICRSPETFSSHARVVRSLEGVVMLTTIGVLGTVLTYVAMLHSHGYADDLLHRADQALGFSWPATHKAAAAHPLILRALEVAYSSFLWLPFVVLWLQFRANRPEQMYRFLLAYGLALAATVAIFYFFPARAAFAYYLGAKDALPSNAEAFGRAIAGLRSGTTPALDLVRLEGIVTFPSFHAAMAVLYAWAAWEAAGRLRVPIVAINALMWIAAAPVGGHYLVDLIGGSIVAIAAIYLACRIGASASPPNLASTTVPEAHPVAHGAEAPSFAAAIPER